ncbi:MAG TPA: glycogen/starch/alpha-glucan phosphorylase [Candidatus Omnitrophota bacterium]|nr:glycogen/starch/alpha-glucan phosphorylase [Candidatus Omnitrophota bacterium]HPS36870.1 glycogen/starch/alpha-glucan phosphorylase [Candidatus Omnitrophota bacterium]
MSRAKKKIQEPEPEVKELWQPEHKGMTKEGLKLSFSSSLQYGLAKDQYTATSRDNFMALGMSLRDRLVERWIQTQQGYHKKKQKRVYYLSLEFLIGRLLGNYVLNLGLWDQTQKALEEFGLDLEKVRNEEVDAGLGNGGLGRLAACFLDSMATLGIPAHGYGIRYDYGIFNQKIVNGYQVESPDEWLKHGNPWEFARPEYSQKIKFYGNTNMYHDKQGRLSVEWVNTEDVLAMPYDTPVPGYQNDVVNTLRLWSAKSSEEFDFQYFNDGDYERAVYDKMFTENISKVLYPNDATSMGRELRLKQEYFFTAASIADIIRRFKEDNAVLKSFPDKATIQLNDTHPALAIVEFMRILIDEEQVDWDTAWDLTVRTFAYTNHTVMPEALECWAVPMFEKLLPRHMQIVYEINGRFLKDLSSQYPGDPDRLRRMSVIEEGNPKRIRMAFLAIIGSHSVNGVSELHSELLKEHLFRDFYEVFPEKFNNKTNGISHRRWLIKANRPLARLLDEAIGESWERNLSDLDKLIGIKKDRLLKKKWQQVKRDNKKVLAELIRESTGVIVNPDSIFDVQVKRIHEYKRQTLFILYAISEYLKLRENPAAVLTPRTFIFGGKAAPGYFMAKLIIKFINNVADVINHDKLNKDKLKVVFLENYRVSLAEKIFPASDLSEQISTAGTEASGTGCMKFMMNGALTVGTYDGANIEIAAEVGEENIFMFGLKAPEVLELKNRGYDPNEFIRKSPRLGEILQMIRNNFFSPMEPGIFDPLVNNLTGSDPYLVCADFDAYCAMQGRISEEYQDQDKWTEKAILNVAKSGKFSSDRTIEEYARDIWNVPVQIPR